MKIVVGVDGSSNSFAAVEFVGRLVSPESDQLVLLFATPSISMQEEHLDPAVEERARSALSRTVLDAAIDRLPEAWRDRAETRMAEGSASSALLDAAKDDGADLIVVGFQGSGRLIEQFVLGSVSRTVVHSAAVPVLVVKSGAEIEKGAKGSESKSEFRALAAYDESTAAEKMTGLLAHVTWPASTRSWMITVVPPMFHAELPEWIKIERDPDVAAMADAWQREHQQHTAAAREELERFRTTLPECFAQGEIIVAEGRPAEVIVKKVRELAIDLVVVGSRDRGPIKRLLIGSTSEQVLNLAPCSVLIVR